MRNSNFFGAPSPGGRSVREITSREETERLTSREETERPPEESTRQIPARSRLSQEPKARWRSGRQIEPLPSRSGRLLDYESSGSPSPSQILPLTGNRKPASDRTHWLQPVPCSSRRRSCPGGERGDRQSSVPADSTPSQTQPTGRRIGGYDYKTESFQRPRVDLFTHPRKIQRAYL